MDDSEDSLLKLLNGSGDGDTIPSDSPAEDDLPEGLAEAVEGFTKAASSAERARHFRNAVTFCNPETPTEEN